MENMCLRRLVFTVVLAMCSADYNTDDLYDIMASKFDNVYFDIRNMRNDIKEISEKNEVKASSGQTDKCEDMREMLENVKTETAAKLSQIEEKMLNVNNTITNELERMGNDRGDLNAKVEESLHILRSAVTDGKKHVHEVVNSFESRIELVEKKVFALEKASLKGDKGDDDIPGKKYVHDLVSSFESRVEHVEKKMSAFEDASWKGDKGDVGMPGPRGLIGVQGKKGEKGQSGNNGRDGEKGAKGSPSSKGEKGKTGRPGPRGFRGSQGEKGEKGVPGTVVVKGVQQIWKNLLS